MAKKRKRAKAKANPTSLPRGKWIKAQVRVTKSGKIEAKVPRSVVRRGNPDGDYEVVVGNIGSVYSGPSKTKAATTYATYVRQSKKKTGRASGEDVTMFKDGDIVREHGGSGGGW